jgi:NAD(P)-dependent dehydrogenase (short-subunit alcohol dehydrogenase family)
MTDELFSVRGKTALVTGASAGIGKMIASALVSRGADVWICARNATDLEATRAELSAFGRCRAIEADLSTEDGIAAVAAVLTAETDALNILVNNAGTSWGAPLGTFPRDGFEKVLNLNLLAPFELVQRLLPLILAGARAMPPANIINIASVDGIRPPVRDSFAYSSSKAGVIMLTRHLAQVLAGDGVTVNAIAPGVFPSRLTAHILDPDHPRYVPAPSVPLGRIGEPDDIAGAILYLGSRAGSYVTGATLPVGGGLATTS